MARPQIRVDVNALAAKLGRATDGLKDGRGVQVTFSGQRATRIARWLHDGTKHIPKRAWTRDFIRMKGGPSRYFTRIAVQCMVYDKTKKTVVLDHKKLGKKMVDDVRKFFQITNWYAAVVPNARSTIKRKGFNMPYTRTGAMMRTLRWYEVSSRPNSGGIYFGGKK